MIAEDSLGVNARDKWKRKNELLSSLNLHTNILC